MRESLSGTNQRLFAKSADGGVFDESGGTDESDDFDGSSGRLEQFTLPALHECVRTARGLLSRQLVEWGAGPQAVDEAVLVLSELFTNAIVHTDSRMITCQLRAVHARLYLAVSDEGGAREGESEQDCGDEGGRGLVLVDALTERWGVTHAQGAGRIVWAVLPMGAPRE